MERGCEICSRVLAQLRLQNFLYSSDGSKFSLSAEWMSSSHGWPEELAFFESGIGRSVHFDMRLERPTHTSLNRFSNRNYIVPQLSVGATTADIKIEVWVEECNNKHNCVARTRQGWTRNPPRLLHIPPGHVQLVETPEGPPQCTQMKYSTLSHCWGTSHVPLRLTTCNYMEFKQTIDSDKLPPTFLHAIDISRKLGLEWLWIDSLCIIQEGAGQKEDWALHVREMAAIYRHAYINIAASHAKDATQGCYIKPDPIHASPASVRIGPEQKQLMLRDCDQMVTWPLNTRAWVLQERLLSARVLHYGRTGVYFECAEHIMSTRSVEQPDGDMTSYLRDSYRWAPFDWHKPVSGEGKDLAYTHWQELLASYSRCQITNPSDRLPAIAGIARACAFNEAYLNDKYIAGFFREQLPWALMWRLLDPETPERKDTYVGPSWSWISHPGATTLPDAWMPNNAGSLGDIVARIDNIHLVLEDMTNPYGKIKAASLLVSGPVLSLSRIQLTEFARNEQRLEYAHDLHKYRRSSSIYLSFDSEREAHDKIKDVIRLLVIQETMVGSRRGGRFLEWLAGLVLISEDLEQNVCRRIGTFHIKFDDGKDAKRKLASRAKVAFTFDREQLTLV